MSSKLATIKAVAERAGVSTTTVSHTLNHADRVTPELRERVLKAANDMGYQPSPYARSLRLGRTGLVAVMIPDICNPVFPEITRAIQDELAKAGLDTVIYNTDVPAGMSALYASHYRSYFSSKRFDGIIISDPAILDTESAFENLDLPIVRLGTSSEIPMDKVCLDEHGVGYDAARYLIQHGHRRIGIITGEQRFFSGRETFRGFRDALSDFGLPLDEHLVFPGTYLRQAGSEGIQYMVGLETPPTAVLAANDVMAITAVACLLDMGKRIPEDMAIIGIDNMPQTADIRPALTTVDRGLRAQGQAAAELLLRRLQGEKSGTPETPETIVIPHYIVERISA
jgi:DNA-binding LacI/PurR family transcriptional regulator